MQLPADEERDEEKVRKPKPVEVLPSTFLDGKPDENRETDNHDPPGDAGTGGEVDGEEGGETLADGL
jgi:hypothetical protein